MNSIKIEVTQVPQSRTFGENTFWSQQAYMHRDNEKYPEKISLSLESPDASYAIGFYSIDFENALSIGQYGNLQFVRSLPIIPLKG